MAYVAAALNAPRKDEPSVNLATDADSYLAFRRDYVKTIRQKPLDRTFLLNLQKLLQSKLVEATEDRDWAAGFVKVHKLATEAFNQHELSGYAAPPAAAGSQPSPASAAAATSASASPGVPPSLARVRVCIRVPCRAACARPALTVCYV